MRVNCLQFYVTFLDSVFNVFVTVSVTTGGNKTFECMLSVLSFLNQMLIYFCIYAYIKVWL